MSIIVEGPDENGWAIRRCARPGCPKITKWTPDPPERIHFACLAWPRRWEIGTWFSLILEAIGVSKYRWSWINRKLGLVEPGKPGCYCPEREKWLNTLGGKLVTMAESGKWYGRLLAWLLVTRAKEPPSP